MFDFSEKQANYSFLLDGKSFREAKHEITTEKCGNIQKNVYYFDGGLKLTNTFTSFPEYNACEWVNYWENVGDEPSMIPQLVISTIEINPKEQLFIASLQFEILVRSIWRYFIIYSLTRVWNGIFANIPQTTLKACSQERAFLI